MAAPGPADMPAAAVDVNTAAAGPTMPSPPASSSAGRSDSTAAAAADRHSPSPPGTALLAQAALAAAAEAAAAGYDELHFSSHGSTAAGVAHAQAAEPRAAAGAQPAAAPGDAAAGQTTNAATTSSRALGSALGSAAPAASGLPTVPSPPAADARGGPSAAAAREGSGGDSRPSSSLGKRPSDEGMTISKPSGLSWSEWGWNKLKYAKQALSERLGSATRTVDTELEEQMSALMKTQAEYRNVVRLTAELTTHLFNMVQTQRQLSAAFGELGVHSQELQTAFTINHDTHKTLVRNGLSLIGAINFFVENVNTLTEKTMEDTLDSWREYETVRLAYDAERIEYERLQAAASPDKARLAASEARVVKEQERLMDVRMAVRLKLQLLDENKIKVMSKQLLLFHNAIVAYFAGNQTHLEQTLAECHIQTARFNEPSSPSWLDKLHQRISATLAPGAAEPASAQDVFRAAPVLSPSSAAAVPAAPVSSQSPAAANSNNT